MGTFTDHAPIMLNEFQAVKRSDPKQMPARRSQAVESPPSQVIKEGQPNTASEAATDMRLDLQRLQPEDGELSGGRNTGPGADPTGPLAHDEGSPVAPQRSKQATADSGITKKGSFERLHAHLLQTQPLPRSNPPSAPGQLQKRRAQRGSRHTAQSNRGGTPHHTSQVRKGQPIKDFLKQVKHLEQAEAHRVGRAQAARTPVLGGGTFYQSSRSPPVSGGGQKQSRHHHSPQAFGGPGLGKGGCEQLSVDELKVRALNTADFRKMERQPRASNAVAGAPVQADRESGDALPPQQHEMVSSDRQLNSAISEDKIKTEKIGEQTVSPENTQRQEFPQNFSNLNVNEEINEQSATAQ